MKAGSHRSYAQNLILTLAPAAYQTDVKALMQTLKTKLY